MLSDSIIQKIEVLANEVAAREGVLIYDIEFSGGAQGRALRVFIDKEGGAGIDDCANVSRGLNLLLDVEDIIPGGKYNLEVSTPGLDRQLKKLWHFEKAVGQKVWLKLAKSLEYVGVEHKKLKSAKQISSVLQALVKEGEAPNERVYLQFEVEGEAVKLPLDLVEKAKLVFDFDEGKNEKKNVSPKPKNKGRK